MHKISDEFKFQPNRTTDYGVSCPWASKKFLGKWCLQDSLFIFDRIIIKVSGNRDRHKSLLEFDFQTNQTIHFGVTCPWVTKISHFWTLISLRIRIVTGDTSEQQSFTRKPVGQSWSNFMCSINRVGERLHKTLGQIGSKLWFPW